MNVLAPSSSHPVMSDFLIVSIREVRLPERNMTRPLLLPLTSTCINDTVSESSFYVQYSCKLTSEFPFADLWIRGFILALFKINSTSPQLSRRETFIVVHPLDSVSTSQMVSFLVTFFPGTGFRFQSPFFYKTDNLSGN